MRRSPELRHTALVVDLRERGFPATFPEVYRALRRDAGLAASLVFLEADDRTLLRRFSETRRPHPFSGREPAAIGIRAEREALVGVRRLADAILDTSRFTVHELRDYVRERYDTRARGAPHAGVGAVVRLQVRAAGRGRPGVRRALPGEPELRAAAAAADRARDAPVVAFLRRKPETARFLKRVLELVGFVLPRHEREGRSYLTLAIGCTGRPAPLGDARERDGCGGHARRASRCASSTGT